MSEIIWEVWINGEGDLFCIDTMEYFEMSEQVEQEPGWEYLGDL